MLNKLKLFWQNIRQLSGDDAYERYLAHFYAHKAEFHADKIEPEPPLSREEFFKQWQDGKWKGVKRCC
jgi:uncharacterized short protein YbdD (DUF466 family)